MPSDKARYIINETICGIENLFCQEFPKREGYIHSYGDQIDAAIAEAVRAEREACAKLAHDAGECMLQDFGLQSALQANADAIAHAIRNRSQLKG